MLSKEMLKKLGIFGISFGLIASPLAFGEATGEEDEWETEDPAQEMTSDDFAVEYENEEEEYDWEEEDEEEEYDWEEEDEEEEWEEEDDSDF